MNIVLDTNVFASGIFWNGTPTKILELWRKHKIILDITPKIFEEYSRVCRVLGKKYSHIDIEPFLESMAIHGTIFPDRKLQKPVCRDPDDDKFIACALSANAKIIVSGDKDLLDIGTYANIRMITPKKFMDEFNS